MPQIYDMGPTTLLPLRRKACWGFFRPKNPMASAGFEPANLGTKGQHATPRPPKPNKCKYRYINLLYYKHLPEEGHNRWPKHVAGYAVHNTDNLHICKRTCIFLFLIMNSLHPSSARWHPCLKMVCARTRARTCARTHPHTHILYTSSADTCWQKHLLTSQTTASCLNVNTPGELAWNIRGWLYSGNVCHRLD